MIVYDFHVGFQHFLFCNMRDRRWFWLQTEAHVKCRNGRAFLEIVKQSHGLMVAPSWTPFLVHPKAGRKFIIEIDLEASNMLDFICVCNLLAHLAMLFCYTSVVIRRFIHQPIGSIRLLLVTVLVSLRLYDAFFDLVNAMTRMMAGFEVGGFLSVSSLCGYATGFYFCQICHPLIFPVIGAFSMSAFWVSAPSFGAFALMRFLINCRRSTVFTGKFWSIKLFTDEVDQS